MKLSITNFYKCCNHFYCVQNKTQTGKIISNISKNIFLLKPIFDLHIIIRTYYMQKSSRKNQNFPSPNSKITQILWIKDKIHPNYTPLDKKTNKLNKQLPERQATDISRLFYNPINKIQRSKSQIFKKTMLKISQQLKENQQNQSNLSKSNSQRRFVRKTDKFNAYDMLPNSSAQKHKNNQQEKQKYQSREYENQIKLRFENNLLKNENLELMQQIKEKDTLLQKIQTEIIEKNKLIEELLFNKTAFENKLNQTSQILHQQVKKTKTLSDENKNLQARLKEIKRCSYGLQEFKWQQKISIIEKKLKYKQVQVDILKNKIFALKNTVQKVSTLEKQTEELKKVISLLLKRKKKQKTDKTLFNISLLDLSSSVQQNVSSP